MKRLFALITVVALMLSVFTVMPKAQTAVYEYYKSQLNADEQKIYEAFLTAAKSPAGECDIPTLSTIQYTFSANITTQQQLTNFVNNDPSCKASISKLNLYFRNAVHAVAMDHAELYWLDNNELGQIYYGYSSKASTVSIIDVIVNIPTPQPNATLSLNAVNEKFKSIGATGTDIEKVKKIHDWLCNNVQYVSGNHAHDLYGSLFNGKAVCQGYAEAFKAACDYYGVKCVCVEGEALNSKGVREAHMWNYVLINNTWYAIDVTWDDQGNKIYYDYFLAGKNTIAEHFDDKKFIESHISNGLLGGSGQKEFNYPSLSEKGYAINNPTQKPTQKPTDQVAQNTSTAKPTAKPTENSNVTGAPQNTQAPQNTATANTGENQTPNADLIPTATNTVDNISPIGTPPNQNTEQDNNSTSTKIILACSGIGAVILLAVVVMIIRKKR